MTHDSPLLNDSNRSRLRKTRKCVGTFVAHMILLLTCDRIVLVIRSMYEGGGDGRLHLTDVKFSSSYLSMRNRAEVCHTAPIHRFPKTLDLSPRTPDIADRSEPAHYGALLLREP